MASSQSLESLGATIAELTKTLSTQLQAAKIPELSFAPDAPASLPPTPEVQIARTKLQEALLTLNHLVTGPHEFWLREAFAMSNDPLTYDVLNHFNFWDAVPVDGSASYAEIAKATRLPEQIVRRFLRNAIASFIFAEEAPNSDRVVHTLASAQVARNPQLRSLIAHCAQDVRPAAVHGVEALEKWFVDTEELTEDRAHSAFPLATDYGKQRGTDQWTFLENYERPGQPKGFRAKQFAEAMQALGDNSALAVEPVLAQFDWESLGNGTVVDIGGSAGHISAVLAKKYPQLNLVVQDLAPVEPAFDANMKAEGLADRIRFQAYDLFTKQELVADVYLVKSVFHDWSDRYVLEMLQNQLPVIKPGNHLLIYDLIVPPDYDERGVHIAPLTARKFVALVDLQMHVAFNAKERKVEDWLSVVKRADPRFALKGVHVIPGVPLGIMDFVLEA
ncbi:O-methyltransferase [Thozetella sp. PMI_491]|nr:O-methyltransferase [Thozetella sp. PMI_491]